MIICWSISFTLRAMIVIDALLVLALPRRRMSRVPLPVTLTYLRIVVST